MPILSSWCRGEAAPGEIARRAAALGATGFALDATLEAGYLAALRAELMLAGLPIVCVEAPCPRGVGRRAPCLATDDKDERSAAVQRTADAITLAAETGARVVVTRLGFLPSRNVWSELVESFARRSLGRGTIERLAAERVQMAARALDLARFGLEPVVARAASASVTLAICNPARWFELPDEMEARALLEDFRGAPLATWFDAAAAHARQAMGFGSGALADRAAGAWLTDASGLRGGLPWGRGEATLPKLPDGALQIVHCALGTDEELAAAMTTMATGS